MYKEEKKMGLTFVDEGNVSLIPARTSAKESYSLEEFKQALIEGGAASHEVHIQDVLREAYDSVPEGYMGIYLQLRNKYKETNGGALSSTYALRYINIERKFYTGFIECFLKLRNDPPGKSRRTEKEAESLAFKELDERHLCG